MPENTLPLEFTKLSACGNDFVAIDNRNELLNGSEADLLRYLCDRRLCAGADGVLFVEKPRIAETLFHMRIFNPDGSEAWMCGNGARACAQFAHQLGIGGNTLLFGTRAGLQRVTLSGSSSSLWLPDPTPAAPPIPDALQCDTLVISQLQGSPLGFVRVGVPHFVVLCETDIWHYPIESEGPLLRYHNAFAPEGSNVMFVQQLATDELLLRAWEKGVEAETWGCGTGSVAACLLLHSHGKLDDTVCVHMKGGDLIVSRNDSGWSFSGEIHTSYHAKTEVPI